MPSISYAITACNEHVELDRLLNQLTEHIRSEDEIIVQIDSMNATTEVMAVLATYHDKIHNSISFTLMGDFASFKNNLKEHCSKDYIFQIDADEYLSETLLEYLTAILEDNTHIEMLSVPRINTVEGLTQEHIQRWGWNISEEGWVNYPDYQNRIFKNKPEIYWVNKVHEKIIGAMTTAEIPYGLDLIHPKTIGRQEKQNNFYNTL
jgi:glycosyltransferase involved in cell wall biosynthesis